MTHPRLPAARSGRPWPRRGRGWFRSGYRAALAAWPVRGYNQVGAGQLVAVVAYRALVALVPTFLLLVAVAGLLLRRDAVLATAVRATVWALPSADVRDALDAVLAARRNGGWFGLASLLGFLWTGTTFTAALAQALDRVYGVPDCGYVCSRRRGFVMVALFAVLFLVAALASTLPTLFVGRHLDPYFRTWALARAGGQVLGYALGFLAAAALFLVLYRVLPNAGQRVGDVWPGALVAGALFLVLGQAFPLYARLVGGGNRYGALFGLVSLLVAWFGALAHVLLFGAYVNASYQRRGRGHGTGQLPPGAQGNA